MLFNQDKAGVLSLKNIIILPCIYMTVFFYLFMTGVFAEDAVMPEFSQDVFSKDTSSPVELNGDQVEFIMEGNKLIATGHVSIVKGETTLTADRVEFSRDSKVAVAEGHVVLKSPQGRIEGDKFVYNFDKMTGDFANAKIASAPFYGAGESVAKISATQIAMKNGYLTTCDLCDPHFRLKSRDLSIFPRDKMIARNVKMLVGKAPIMYLPKYTQRLDGKPRVTYTPGYDKNWGAFLLTSWRYHFSDDFKGAIHVDYRERKDLASGVDLDYKMKKYGYGSIRTYYMNERPITSKYTWQPRPSPTPEHERFKAEWRHRWEIDQATDLSLQYYKLSDSGFLKDYFKRAYEKDSSPQSFFLLTRNLSNGTLSFRTDAVVNRFAGGLERLPEVRYDVSSQKIGDTGFYFRSANGFVNLARKDPQPTEVRKETMRLDSENQLSYPMKIKFLEFRPYVGGRQTYYSKTIRPERYDILRGIFTTGADLSSHFYRLFDVYTNLWGMDVNKIRHVITPSVAYVYTHDPTVPPSQLDTFDGVDSIGRAHRIDFTLENKLQTKREGKSVDFLRMILTSDFHLKEDLVKGGFGRVRSDIEFKPRDKIRFILDSDYDTKDHRLASTNFELYLNDQNDKWYFSLGKRYSPDVDDQITTEFGYIINKKWKFRTYRRFDIAHGNVGSSVKAQEYTITRDLHCWEMDINFNETRGSGSEIWIVFRLKAFPDMGLDFGTSFNKRKAGSQSGS